MKGRNSAVFFLFGLTMIEELTWPAALAYLIMGVAGLAALVKQLAPQAFDGWVKSKQAEQATDQQANLSALQQTVNVNDVLVKAFIRANDRLDTRLGELIQVIDKQDKRLDTISQHIGRSSTSIEINNRDRVRLEEVLDDIDQMLHANQELIRTMILRNESTLKNE